MNPALAVAYIVMTHSLQFGPHMPIRSPFFSPKEKSPAASLSACINKKNILKQYKKESNRPFFFLKMKCVLAKWFSGILDSLGIRDLKNIVYTTLLCS